MIIDNMDTTSEDIDTLLKDIYEYLKRKKENRNLSADDRKIAENLIDRSKKQLQRIAKTKVKEDEVNCYDFIDSKIEDLNCKSDSKKEQERYVDMTKKQPVGPPPPIPFKKPELKPQKSPSESECPFKELPARQASHEIKHGTLSMRRKVFNIIDRSMKTFGAIHENWLLMYWSSKDTKPFCTIDLKEYEAKEDEYDPTMTELDIIKDDNPRKNGIKMASSFKVVQSSFVEKKNYSFVATTHKDMLQWVVNINRSHDKAVRAGKDIEDQIYDICEEPPENIEEENFYHEIPIKPTSKPAVPTPKTLETEKPPPRLPAKPLPRLPSLSECENDDIYQQLVATDKKPSTESLLSLDFSEEEDEDQTYFSLSTIRNEVEKLELKNENDYFNVDIPPPELLLTNLSTTDDKENLTYENGFPSAPPIFHDQTNISTADKEETNTEVPDIKPKVSKATENLVNEKTTDKNSITPLGPKPNKILSNKPWTSFRKNLKKEISNRSKSPSPSTEKTGVKETSLISDSLMKEDSKPKKICGETAKKEASPNQAISIVKIFRQRFSTMESQSRNLETFSRNSKLETFQASPTKDHVQEDFDYMDPLLPVDALESKVLEPKQNKKRGDDEKPMVLLKPSLEEEDSSKKIKKSPVIPIKPKRAAKK